MKTINLRDYYPFYHNDLFIEVSDEVAAALQEAERQERNYDTPGVSHVGIYVGDGWMLHCGDPIGYANLNTSYWQSHFYAYGRL